jgi:hypothetical protein
MLSDGEQLLLHYQHLVHVSQVDEPVLPTAHYSQVFPTLLVQVPVQVVVVAGQQGLVAPLYMAIKLSETPQMKLSIRNVYKISF